MQKYSLYNKTKSQTITDNLYIASNFFLRLKGLLGKTTMEQDEALLIPKCNSIHTFFMQFPIDVVFVNESYEVTKLVENIKPWRLVLPQFKASQTIEFNSGFLSTTNIEVGDQFDVSS